MFLLPTAFLSSHLSEPTNGAHAVVVNQKKTMKQHVHIDDEKAYSKTGVSVYT